MSLCKECKKFSVPEKTEKMDCHDCDAKPGEPHDDGCDTEWCTSCGGQRMCCDCEDHDKQKAAWTGYWPGSLEAMEKGVCLNCLSSSK